MSADGSSQAELQLLQKDAETSERLHAVLQSDYRGMDGHVDGIENGRLVGWAARRGQQHPTKIWLQGDRLTPVELSCTHWRDGMNNQCGFLLELDSLSAGWGGQNIWCSFDRAGLWRIPQNEDLYVPAEGSDVTANLVKNSDSSALAAMRYPDQIELAPQELHC